MPAARNKEQASVTLVALCFTTVLAIALTSYVVLCQRSYDLSTRGIYEDKVRQLAQTGLEESLWALNQNTWTTSGPASNSTWGLSGSNRTLTLNYSSLGQGTSGQLVLTVANYTSSGPTWPTITSAATLTFGGGRTLTKTLRATTRPAPLFNNAIASVNSYVSFTSRGTVDSWNSDPGNTGNYTTAYSFSSSNPANFAAVVAGKTDSGTPAYGVLLTQALVRGYTATSGNAVLSSTSGSPKGRVQGTGSLTDMDGARLSKSAFVPDSAVFNLTAPSASATNSLTSIVTLVTRLLGSVPYGNDVYEFNSDLIVNGVPVNVGALIPALLPQVSPVLVIDRPVAIVVNGNFTLGQLFIPLLGSLFKGKVTITPTGSLQLFVTGDITIGADGFDNQTNDPRKLAIFGTSSSSLNSLQYTTGEDFCGVIYCENKPIDIQSNVTFHGALLSKQAVRFTGGATNPTFHYDTALRKVRFTNVSTPYLIDQLTEP